MTRLSMHQLKKAGLQSHLVGYPENGFYEYQFALKIDGSRVAEYWLPVKIWSVWVPSEHPHTKEPMDTGVWLQRALINGVEVDPVLIWVECCARPITESQYDEMLKATNAGNLENRS